MTQLLTPDAVVDRIRDNKALYQRIVDGKDGTIYTSKEHSEKVKECARQQLSLIDQFVEEYTRRYNATHLPRQKKAHLRYVDLGLTNFLSDYFNYPLPTSGSHGVLDMNRVGKRVFAVYAREKNLKNKQYISLDDKLKDLFSSPSITNPSKSYLDLTHDAIKEKEASRTTAHHPSCANILEHDDQVYLNISALNILISKLSIDYTPSDADKYVSSLEEFANIVDARYNALIAPPSTSSTTSTTSSSTSKLIKSEK